MTELEPATTFSDPIAAKTQWTPLVPGGANFITHRLVETGPSRLAMQPSTGLTLFGLAFLVAGLGTSLLGVLIGEWMVAVFGLPFAGVGVYVLWPRTSVFDGGARTFTGKTSVPFSGIHALQIIRERVTSSEDPDYDSFELNVVLSSGKRINVTDHSTLVQIRADAQRLSALVGCKVWDASPR